VRTLSSLTLILHPSGRWYCSSFLPGPGVCMGGATLPNCPRHSVGGVRVPAGDESSQLQTGLQAHLYGVVVSLLQMQVAKTLCTVPTTSTSFVIQASIPPKLTLNASDASLPIARCSHLRRSLLLVLRTSAHIPVPSSAAWHHLPARRPRGPHNQCLFNQSELFPLRWFSTCFLPTGPPLPRSFLHWSPEGQIARYCSPMPL